MKGIKKELIQLTRLAQPISTLARFSLQRNGILVTDNGWTEDRQEGTSIM
jgi:hypothetical protein